MLCVLPECNCTSRAALHEDVEISMVSRRIGVSPSVEWALTSRELVDERQRLCVGGGHDAHDERGEWEEEGGSRSRERLVCW